MSKGIPLDLWLSGDHKSLTENELDAQLQGDIFQSDGSSPKELSPKKAPVKGAAAPNVESLLTDAMARIEDEEEKHREIDVAVKAASHGVKVLSPLLSAATKWADPENEPDKLSSLVGRVLNRVRTDASSVISAYGIEPADAPAWLTSQVSGQIMGILVSALERGNGAIMDAADIRYLQPLLDHAHSANGINDSIYAHPSDPKWQMINALAMATSDVMSEYHSFDYFHESASEISQQVSQFLSDRVIQDSLEPLAERFGLDANEKSYLGVSLIRQAGKALADSWTTNIVPTLEFLKSMNKEVRHQAMASGYPLDVVFDGFETVYQGLEISVESAIRTMSPGREINMSKKNDPSLG